jgi:phage I-like protein
MLSQFLFVELSEGQPVEVLRSGTFLDRNGREVKVSEEDLSQFVAAFQAGATGQDVPIDIQHERAEAAGWIKKIYLEDGRLLALPDWNELGKRLVKERIYRYLSATIDMVQKAIKSVSLVNFPAVKGLKPVELSEGVYSFQADEGWLDALVARIATVLKEAFGLTPEAPPEGAPPPVEEAEFVIRKEGSEIILYSSDGEKVLGRFPFGSGEEYGSEEAAREAAAKREREIQYFKHEGGEAEAADWTELQGNIRSIVGAWTQWAGSFTKCVRVLKGKPGISNEEELCAWLHHEAEGKWPAEGAEYSPTLRELAALAGMMSTLIPTQEVEDMNEEQLKELREQIRGEILAELEQDEKNLAEMREEVRKEVEVEMQERFERRKELVEFAEGLCSGDAALAAKPDDVVAFLEDLDGDQLERAKALLQSKVVDLSERGSAREGRRNGRKELPKEVQLALDGGDLKVADLGNQILDLGDLSEYDLSKWESG